MSDDRDGDLQDVVDAAEEVVAWYMSTFPGIVKEDGGRMRVLKQALWELANVQSPSDLEEDS